MGMFNTFGFPREQAGRKASTWRKRDRIYQALRHEEPDRVPISDFFWRGFTRRGRQELGLPADASPHYCYDQPAFLTEKSRLQQDRPEHGSPARVWQLPGRDVQLNRAP